MSIKEEFDEFENTSEYENSQIFAHTYLYQYVMLIAENIDDNMKSESDKFLLNKIENHLDFKLIKPIIENRILFESFKEYLEAEIILMPVVKVYQDINPKFWQKKKKEEKRRIFDEILRLTKVRNDKFNRFEFNVKLIIKDFDNFIVIKPIQYQIEK